MIEYQIVIEILSVMVKMNIYGREFNEVSGNLFDYRLMNIF